MTSAAPREIGSLVLLRFCFSEKGVDLREHQVLNQDGKSDIKQKAMNQEELGRTSQEATEDTITRENC